MKVLAKEAYVVLRNDIPVDAFRAFQGRDSAFVEASRRIMSDAYDLDGKRVSWAIALFTRADAGEEVT
jgi:hypothetical protein